MTTPRITGVKIDVYHWKECERRLHPFLAKHGLTLVQRYTRNGHYRALVQRADGTYMRLWFYWAMGRWRKA